MNIIVCLKQTPETEAPVRFRADGRGIEEGGVNFVVNYYDEHAVEEALRVKEAVGGTVTVIAVGPPRAAEALRAALAMGADTAVHVQDPALEDADHLAVARVLAAAISSMPCDLVLCGKLATDDNAAIVGPALAEFLSLPQVTAVVKLEVAEGKAIAHRETEGAVEVLQVVLPAVVTVEHGINEPRYPSLPGKMKARRAPIASCTLGDLGVDPGTVRAGAVRVRLLGLAPPPRREDCRILEGEPAEVVRELVRLLYDEARALEPEAHGAER